VREESCCAYIGIMTTEPKSLSRRQVVTRGASVAAALYVTPVVTVLSLTQGTAQAASGTPTGQGGGGSSITPPGTGGFGDGTIGSGSGGPAAGGVHPGASGLPFTGADVKKSVEVAAAALVVGAGLTAAGKRRSAPETDPSV
jgi:hypothetical protein